MPCAEWMMALTSALYLLHTVKQNGGLSLMLLYNSRSLGLCLQQVAALSLDIRINTRTVPFVLLMLWASSLLLCICRSENQARVVRKKDNTIQRIAFVLLTLIHWKTRVRILFSKQISRTQIVCSWTLKFTLVLSLQRPRS